MEYGEFIKKYGKEKVKFASYYKFSFCFKNEETGLSVSVGGNADDIYRLEVEPGKEYTIAELQPYSAYLNDENLGCWYD